MYRRCRALPGVTGEHVQGGPDDAVVAQLAALMPNFNRSRIAETVLGAVRA
ncbi:hypothetical protein CCUG60884_00348 [Mycobacteroides salmoniphilum]|uniref:Uncharacterized protein n=1 Tax=Mycobacteroides salmoniphilum TaxID=404941 RepID=A0A4R8SZR8_9MYCO|nr:hypothetical protein CCUG60884_00348 [Mycobacteroides salmoniphilum]